MKKKIEQETKDVKPEKTSFLHRFPILIITLKAIIVVAIFGAAIRYSDGKGYFNPDESNNHTKKKWNAFYKFTKRNNVDVILVGNSHLYSGINPKNLSSTLGVNAFILASPGTNIADSYYCLEEALKVTDPKLVVVETYGFTAFNPYELKGGALADQFKSFSARKDFGSKLGGMPFLFRSDDYLYAWSNTIRNHDFIFNDTNQLKLNLEKKKPKKNKKLYLGRFVRFQKGLKKDVLSKYDSLGAPVDGSTFKYNEYSKMYVNKIIDLCKEKGIEVVFLTLPMYHKHVTNYDVWGARMKALLPDSNMAWLDLQGDYDSTRFVEFCFENTYKENQHMTYSGSLIATYKLADFIKSKVSVELPNRTQESKWKANFYGEEGYFENNPIRKSDTKNKLICENFKTNNVTLFSVSVLNGGSKKSKVLMALVDTANVDISKCKLRLAISFMNKKKLQFTNVDLKWDVLHEVRGKYLFKVAITPVDVKGVKGGVLICE
jgi:hypothetical protein